MLKVKAPKCTNELNTQLRGLTPDGIPPRMSGWSKLDRFMTPSSASAGAGTSIGSKAFKVDRNQGSVFGRCLQNQSMLELAPA